MRCATTSFSVSLVPLLPMLDRVLSSLLVWPIGSIGTSVQPLPMNQALAIQDAPMLAPIVPLGRAAAASSSSSSSIAPLAPQPEQDPNQSIAEAFALGALHEAGAASERVRFDALRYVEADTIRRLERHGLVSLDDTEFGETTIALVMAAHSRIPVYGLRAPVPAIRTMSSAPPLKSSKMAILVRLHEDGWRPTADDVAQYVGGADKVYVPGLTQPLSYFVALLDSERIFAKGVPAVAHKKSNHYYLCLLRLQGQPLLALLDTPDENDGWFRKQLKRFEHTNEDSGSDEGGDDDAGDPVPLPEVPGLLPMLAPIALPERIPWHLTEWRRCFVSFGGLRTKVWFDDCSGAGGVRRGWSNCSTHRCGKIRPVVEDRNYFACAMVLWLAHGVNDEATTRDAHMSFWPTDADVREALPHCTFENF